MNAKTFLDNFKFVVEAPGGVKRVREMVLQLAVQGRLVEQRSGDEPASVLLEKIVSEKDKLARNGILKKQEQFPVVNINDVPYKIPEKWIWTRFGNITINRDGERVPISKNNRFQIQGKYDYYGASGVIDKVNNFVFDKDLLLIGEDGANLINRTTPIAFIASGKYWVNNHAHVIDATHFQILLYLEKCINAIDLKPYVTGTAQPKMNQVKMNSIPIPLPPLAEQHRIVTKVDELMAICDKIESQQQECEMLFPVLSKSCHERFISNPTMENLKAIFEAGREVSVEDLRKTVLDLAVRGRLVEQNENLGTAKDLLTRLEKERVKIANQKKYRLPKGKQMESLEDNPFLIPFTWRWTPIANLAVLIDYGTSQKSHDNTNGVPVYRMGNIQNGILNDDNMKYVPKGIKDLPRLYLKNRDILFNRTNSYELVGKTGLFTGNDDTSTFASYLIRIQIPKDIISPEYVCLAMNAPYFRRTQIEPEIVQQCGQANFNGTKLSETLVPVPPLEEQLRIIVKVNQLMSLIDHLESQFVSRTETVSLFAQAAVAFITGTQHKDNKLMKAPKTELITKLILGSKPKQYIRAPLAQLLSEHKGALSAKELWHFTDLEIDEFYQQLKIEMANGWIKEPEKATMKEQV